MSRRFMNKIAPPPLSPPRVGKPNAESQLRYTARMMQFHFARRLHSVRALTPPRRFHAFGIGIGKSGTHSLAGIFRQHYRAAHQPQSQITIDRIDANWANRNSADMQTWLQQRDQSLWLEMESSPYLIEIVPALAAAFPKAKFVLLLRDCYTWLNSTINYSLAVRPTEKSVRHRALLYGQNGNTFTPADRILETCGLYSINAYLSAWARRNNFALEQIPSKRLLVIRTYELRNSIPRLAQFLNFAPETLNAGNSHLYRTNKDFGILHQIDRAYLQDRVQQYCQPLMQHFFPHIQCADDALPDSPHEKKH